MNKYADALANAMLVSVSEEIDRTHNPKLTKGRIVGISGDNYIVELLGNQYTISSISGAKHRVNEVVWVCKPYGENTEQFILGGEITDKTTVGTVLSVNNKEGNVVLDKADIGLNNVDNTSDLKKPISTETQTALDNKVDKVSGKQLSDENYTLAEKNRLSNLTDNATKVEKSYTNGNIKINSTETNVYTHPSSHIASIITQDSSHRFVTDTEKNNWNDSNDKKHTHINKGIIDTITQTLMDTWNTVIGKAEKTYVDTELAKKSNTTHTHSDSHSHSNKSVLDLITSTKISNWDAVNSKVDKITGKGLSTEDYTLAEKTKLESIENNANDYTHPSTHPSTMITGLTKVANTGDYNDLINKPLILNGKDGVDGYTPIKGIDYFDGEKGDKPNHRWISQTQIQFENPDGTWGTAVSLDPEAVLTHQEHFDAINGQEIFNLAKGAYRLGTNSINWYLDGIKQANDALEEPSSTSVKIKGGVPEGSVIIEYLEFANVAIGLKGDNGEKGEKGEKGETGSDAAVNKTNVLNAIGYAPVSPNQVLTDVPLNAKFTDTIVDISGKVDNSRVLTDVPLNAKFTDTVVDISGKADKTYVDNELLNKVDKVSGKQLSTNDYTTIEKNKLSEISNGAEVNQNAFSNVKIGTTTISADTKSDTLEFVAGTGITLTPDATNDKVTITGVNQYTHPASHPASMITGLPTSLPASGGNADTVNGKTVGTNVPTGAKFTDTVYSHPATHSADMITDGTTNKAYTAAEKTKLSGIATKANNYSHPTTHPSSIIVQDTSNRFVTDAEKSTWNGKQNALGYTPLNSTLKGAVSGIAELDANGRVPSSQLPSYVDDVLEYTSKSNFPVTGESGKIYISSDTNLTYRWSGTGYVEISASLALGETSSTAFFGDKGKVAYSHSQTTHAPSNATANDTNANLRNRSTHTGTQSADTVTDGNINKVFSTTEKTKLSGIDTNANNYSHPTSDGSKHVPANGTANNGKVLKAGATAGTYVWSNDNDTITTINGKTGAIAKSDITALGVPAQDTVYTHPANHSASIITQDADNRFVSDSEKSLWGGKQDALGFTPVNTTDSRLSDERTPLTHTHAESEIINLTNDLAGKEPVISTKNTAFNKKYNTLTTNVKMDGTVSVGTQDLIARADHVHPKDTSKANLASPNLTGTPTAPTAISGTNTTQLATTAFVQGAMSSAGLGDMLKGQFATNVKVADGYVDKSIVSDSATNAEKVSGFTVGKSVPSNALFTDTVYTHPPTHSISEVSGLQTALDGKVDDSQVLTNVPLNAKFTDTVYSHPTSHPASMITGLPTSLPADGGQSTSAKHLIGDDTRAINSPPSEYMSGGNRYLGRAGWQTEFKNTSTIGVTAHLSGAYCYIETKNPWSDPSGGYPIQLAYGNGTPVWRIGTSLTAWSEWKPYVETIKTVTSATEPTLNTGDQWHREI